MSQENVEIVRQDIAARSGRDWAVLAEIWHPDIERELVDGSVSAHRDATQGLDRV
jgi:hypothetical protein